MDTNDSFNCNEQSALKNIEIQQTNNYWTSNISKFERLNNEWSELCSNKTRFKEDEETKE